MNKQLRQIYNGRYKRPLLIVLLVFFIFYLFVALTDYSNWKSQYDYTYSQDFIHYFEKDPKSFAWEYDDDAQPITPPSVAAYRLESLTLFWPGYILDDSSGEYIRDNGYRQGVEYTERFGSSWPLLAPILLLFIGFGLFFIDLKTNFNQFLFSLSFTKKDLFRGKMIYFVLPLAGTLAFSVFTSIMLKYLLIPNIYMNATLPQLLYSGFSHWLFLLLSLMLGILLGTLLGHLFLAPVLVIGVILFISTLFSGYSNLTHWFLQKLAIHIPYHILGLFTLLPGKTATPWFLLIGYALLAFGLGYLSERIYQQISLENNGNLITTPKLRFPIAMTVSLLTSSIFLLTIGYNLVSLGIPKILAIIFVPILSTLFSFFLVYFDEIPKHWNHFLHQRALKKTN